jgi:hypothetical protein
LSECGDGSGFCMDFHAATKISRIFARENENEKELKINNII